MKVIQIQSSYGKLLDDVNIKIAALELQGAHITGVDVDTANNTAYILFEPAPDEPNIFKDNLLKGYGCPKQED